MRKIYTLQEFLALPPEESAKICAQYPDGKAPIRMTQEELRFAAQVFYEEQGKLPVRDEVSGGIHFERGCSHARAH